MRENISLNILTFDAYLQENNITNQMLAISIRLKEASVQMEHYFSLITHKLVGENILKIIIH